MQSLRREADVKGLMDAPMNSSHRLEVMTERVVEDRDTKLVGRSLTLDSSRSQ